MQMEIEIGRCRQGITSFDFALVGPDGCFRHARGWWARDLAGSHLLWEPLYSVRSVELSIKIRMLLFQIVWLDLYTHSIPPEA